jgi:phosphatidylglycerol:prolipoprotein diacylglycerol transferase
MIPYLRVPALWLACIPLDAESILTAAGLVIAIFVAHRRAPRFGIDVKRLDSFVVWLLVGALIGGHVADLLCYRPNEIVEFSQGSIAWQKPWELLFVWDGWRSIGGFFGAFLAAIIWRTHLFQVIDWLRLSQYTKIEGYWFVARERAEPILPLADIALSVFPVAWVFNRAGSALIHDHPGRRASAKSLLAVAFPDPDGAPLDGFGIVHGSVPRYDLGLLELLVTALLVVAVVAMWRRRFRKGFYICFAGLTYPPARFVLDFLRRRTGTTVDPIYATLTPAQWGCAILSLLSLIMLLWIWARPPERGLRV